MNKDHSDTDESCLSLQVADGGQSELDRVLDAISHRRRRFVLYCLREDEPRDFDTVVEAVVEYEAQQTIDHVCETVRDRVRANLYHMHLPKLADRKIIEYDERSGAVRYREPPDALQKFLVLSEELEMD